MSTNIVRFADPEGAEWDVFFAAPESMELEDAGKAVQDAYDSVVEELPNDWQWDDVFAKLTPLGFTGVDMITVGG